MKLRQISFKIVSLVMVVAMMFSISATTISAANVDKLNNTAKEEIDSLLGSTDVDEITAAKVQEIVKAAKELAAFVAENYEEAYADAHTELRNNGTIAELNAALDVAMEAVDAASEELKDLVLIPELAEGHELLVEELALAQVTLVEIETLVNYEVITAETVETLELLVSLLGDHLDTVAGLSVQFGGYALGEATAYALEALELVKAFAEELASEAYAYLVEIAPVVYEQLVDALVDAIATYSHEAAKYAYAWLINNPEKVIGFFDAYGDEIVDFVVDHHEVIFCVLGYVGMTYGEDVLCLVLNNADVILPAIVGWSEIHGYLVWDLIVVYFNAIVEYYNISFELDFDSDFNVHAIIDTIYALLGDLIDMIEDGAYDYLESLELVEKINAQLAKLDALLQDGTVELGEFIFDAITAFVDDAVRGEYTPTEDSYYVSVNGGEALYADLLAANLSGALGSEIGFGKTTWDNLDYDMLSKADLVTIGYDENELTAFAVAQLLGYVHDYVDGDVRNVGDDYIKAVFVELAKYYARVQGNLADVHINIPDFDFSGVEGDVDEYFNAIVDGLIGNDELPADLEEALGEEGFALATMANTILAGQSVSELDWAKYVGSENLHYIDDLRAELRAELLANGVTETETIEVSVLEYILPAVEAALGDLAQYFDLDGIAEELASVATVSIEVPVVDSLVFALESYLYSNVEFNYNYGKLIVDLYKMNPDATVILLGHYNAYDYELALGDVTVDLGEAYGYIAGLTSVQPFAYAILSSNVAYVDISDAETYYESYIAGGVDNSLVNFLMAYLANNGITDVTEAGHEYIYEQILGILTIGCEHVYDNACDAECNKCHQLRPVAGHAYDNACDATCNVCGEKRVVGSHKYEGGVCIYCGAIVPVTPVEPDPDCLAGNHSFDNCEDTDCYKCDYVREAIPHVYDNCEDVTCNNCNLSRPAVDHVYSNACDADCNRCGDTREVGEHVYSGCTDATCNNCGLEREASAHKVDDCADNICNVCGKNVAVNGHRFGDWTVTVEPTRKTAGEKTHTCTGCGLVETATIEALGGVSGGVVAGVTVGSVAVAGAAGFAIFWFVLQKKSFAEFLALFSKNAAGAGVESGAEAAAETVSKE